MAVLYRGIDGGSNEVTDGREPGTGSTHIPLRNTSTGEITLLDLSTADPSRYLNSRPGLITRAADNEVLNMTMPGIDLECIPGSPGWARQWLSTTSSGLQMRVKSHVLNGLPDSVMAKIWMRIYNPIDLPTFDQLWVYYNYTRTTNGGLSGGHFSYVDGDGVSNVHYFATGDKTVTPEVVSYVPATSFFLRVYSYSANTGADDPQDNDTFSTVTKVEWRNTSTLVAQINFGYTKVFPHEIESDAYNSSGWGNIA